MMTQRGLGGVAVVLALGSTAQTAPAQQLRALPSVREIPTDTIADVALTTVDDSEPAIYYNPRRMRRLGPSLAQFFLVHEYGHIYYHHTRARLVALPDASRDSVLQVQELEADCYAATTLGARHRDAPEAAVRYFTRLGPFRFDDQHPTGAQRATRILACMPETSPDGLLAERAGDNLANGPTSGRPDPVTFHVGTPTGIGPTDYGREIALWVDGKPVGRISNMRFPNTIAVGGFAAGLHSYRMSLDWYELDAQLQLNLDGTILSTGHFVVRDGDAFTVAWMPGERPLLVKQ